MRTALLCTLLALLAAGCGGGPTLPTGQALADAQDAAQKEAADDERAYQAEQKKAARRR